MSRPKILRIALLSITLCGCTIDDDSTAGDSKTPPKPDGVQFFDRPKLLEKLRRSSEPMPEIVFIERDPWKMVMGSDSPRFALYEDGRVIYRDEEEFRTVQLGAAELEKIREQLSPAHKPSLNGRYEVASATDQPDNSLLFYRGEPVFLDVYGSLDDEDDVSHLSNSVREAFEAVRSFRHARSSRWLPQWIEVMVWPYEHAVGPSIKWKRDWPSVSDQRTVRRGDGYSLFLPATELQPLREFLATKKPQGAVEIDSRKWSVSIRFPFPQEKLWMPPNPEAERPSN